MKFVLRTSSAGQTEEFASRIAAILRAGDIITLDGDLGAGKTCFTRGLARGLNSTSFVSSPTFTIVNEYDGRLPVFHFDTYRLSDSEDFLRSGFDEYFDRDGVCVIEWSNIISDILPENVIGIEITGTGDERNFTIEISDDRAPGMGRIIKEMDL
ncbi:MAG: tRNA (adenosine(37)-N6)-threonylcarbamoyltransferase complex ATPase subunit type 1 TsaE [Clostridiales bacterium]|nr:tRNA (adenosine(37)-N6)-threonylcarbamoyltransferase complex ATPase subunit type 1 TsaE [Clostridiales bacterium]